MLLVTKSDSHICYMAIWDHSGNHHIDKCSEHVCFAMLTVNCYLHAYKTKWHDLYCALYRQFCPSQWIMCITCLVIHIYREILSIGTEKIHHAHFILYHNSWHASGVETKRWIHMLFVHRDENDSLDKFWWIIKTTHYVISNYWE